MTDNVVTFKGNKPPEPDTDEYVFVCGNCRCRTFNLLAGGTIKCSFCDTKLEVDAADKYDADQWQRRHPVLPDDKKAQVGDEPSNSTDTHDTPDETLARRRVMGHLDDWAAGNDLVLIGGYNKHGEGRWWMDIRSDEQKEWVMERLEHLKNWVGERTFDMTHELHITPVDDDDEPENT